MPGRFVAISALLLILLHPATGFAQSAGTTSTSAWWAARMSSVDAATLCGAVAAWDHAMQVTDQAQRDHVATGLVSRTWNVMGGTPDNVVLYTTTVRRTGYLDPATSEVGEHQWVESEQAAYRVVLRDGAWQIADRRAFEQTRRTIDPAEFDAVGQAYQQLLSRLVNAYSGGDLSALADVLDGQALDVYQHALQALFDDGKIQHLQADGTTYIIDVRGGSALAAFQGTLTRADIDQATGHQDLQPPEPVVLLHRLELGGGQWKIVGQSMPSPSDADGTVHILGCGDSAAGPG